MSVRKLFGKAHFFITPYLKCATHGITACCEVPPLLLPGKMPDAEVRDRLADCNVRRKCLRSMPFSMLNHQSFTKILTPWGVALSALACVFAVRAADTPLRREWTVDGIVRQALVYAPAQTSTQASPVVFAFHGHGGSMQNAARSFGYHRLWPEAIVVYPQGLKTPGRLTDPQGLGRAGSTSRAIRPTAT